MFSFGTVQVTPEPVDVPLILGGNTERALQRAASLGDGWFSSGTPTLEESIRLRDRVLALRGAGGQPAFPVYVRMAHPDPKLLGRYEAEGFEHVVVWADQLWPADGDLDHKRRAFETTAHALGVRPT
jgi:alkanesulfonate monooxygenase SsuD/methylene tetrahydromethanopterin reductase-like flavin-dependent oxidoreductase (luciferase family)